MKTFKIYYKKQTKTILFHKKNKIFFFINLTKRTNTSDKQKH